MDGEISRSLGTPIPHARFPEQCVDSRPGDNPLYHPAGAGARRHHPGQESRQPGGIRRFRYEANGQDCPDWFKIPQDLDPASAKWQMFLLGPGATIHA
jgi:hypothetical protein